MYFHVGHWLNSSYTWPGRAQNDHSLKQQIKQIENMNTYLKYTHRKKRITCNNVLDCKTTIFMS